MKRQNYITFDELFMGIAKLASQRSKDPRTQNGVCIVKNNKVVGVGYNGLPYGMSDDEFSWDRDEKYNYVVHAEVNAILNATTTLDGGVLYLYSERGYYPCTRGCSQAIVQSGIKEVVLCKQPEIDAKPEYKGDDTIKMFKSANIKIRYIG